MNFGFWILDFWGIGHGRIELGIMRAEEAEGAEEAEEEKIYLPTQRTQHTNPAQQKRI